MIILVDNEHERGYHQPWGERIMAARVRIKYRLEDMTGLPCLIIRYDLVTPEFLTRLGARAVFISGNSADMPDYDPAQQQGIRSVIAARTWPIFGFCGGFQLMADQYGSAVTRIGRLRAGEEDPHPKYAPGWRKEVGYHAVQITGDHPLLAGLGPEPVMRHAHTWQITAVPPGFQNYAKTAISSIQLIIHDDLPIAGSQFHPEYYTDEYPAGRTLIANFCKWAGLIA